MTSVNPHPAPSASNLHAHNRLINPDRCLACRINMRADVALMPGNLRGARRERTELRAGIATLKPSRSRGRDLREGGDSGKGDGEGDGEKGFHRKVPFVTPRLAPYGSVVCIHG